MLLGIRYRNLAGSVSTTGVVGTYGAGFILGRSLGAMGSQQNLVPLLFR